MALTPAEWGAIAATISAMIDVFRIGQESFEDYFARRLDDPGNQNNALALKSALGTYSDEEVQAIESRIAGCRQRFISEGDGGQRRICLCSVLGDVKAGNGGKLPVSDWEEAYNTLGC